MATITLEDLIEEGNKIRKGISYILKSISEYEIWKNKTIRFLSFKFTGDRCINDFEKAAEDFTKSYNSPSLFDKLLGILESCLVIPELPKVQNENNKTDNSIHVNVNQSQEQSQEQSLAIDIFIEAIKDELTGKQQKEIKAIIENESDPVQAKNRLIDKIKSFGSDVASNVIANIITNPAIW
ncbi:peptide chain release factor 1, partial [Parabacteroides leei]|uniref:peptide chain release factor 1 n=1 Tax=Parabacteroides leei TaxID=2939491 RepID=UPI003242BA5F